MPKLTALKVKSLPPGKYEDGDGLRLVKESQDTGRWVFRYRYAGRRPELGLGSIRDVSLKEARKRCLDLRKMILDGTNPLTHRRQEQATRAKELHLLKDVAADAYESRKASLKGDGKAGRWFSPLALHVLPRLGRLPIATITQQDIRDTIAPIWHDKAPTAMKAIDRLNIVVQHAAALGIDVDLQVVPKAKALLGKQRHQVEQIASMPWPNVPTFYQSLEEPLVSQLALRLLILTGLRSTPIRFARLDDIDGDVWTVPAKDMKARVGKAQDFRVPLSSEALRIISEAARHERDGYLFPGRKTSVISDMSMSAIMKRRGVEARPHGFRSSLRTWLREEKRASDDVAETSIAHTIGTTVTRAYLRTDFLDERKALLEEWGRFCSGQCGTVVPLRREA